MVLCNESGKMTFGELAFLVLGNYWWFDTSSEPSNFKKSLQKSKQTKNHKKILYWSEFFFCSSALKKTSF